MKKKITKTKDNLEEIYEENKKYGIEEYQPPPEQFVFEEEYNKANEKMVELITNQMKEELAKKPRKERKLEKEEVVRRGENKIDSSRKEEEYKRRQEKLAQEEMNNEYNISRRREDDDRNKFLESIVEKAVEEDVEPEVKQKGKFKKTVKKDEPDEDEKMKVTGIRMKDGTEKVFETIVSRQKFLDMKDKVYTQKYSLEKGKSMEELIEDTPIYSAFYMLTTKNETPSMQNLRNLYYSKFYNVSHVEYSRARQESIKMADKTEYIDSMYDKSVGLVNSYESFLSYQGNRVSTEAHTIKDKEEHLTSSLSKEDGSVSVWLGNLTNSEYALAVKSSYVTGGNDTFFLQFSATHPSLVELANEISDTLKKYVCDAGSPISFGERIKKLVDVRNDMFNAIYGIDTEIVESRMQRANSDLGEEVFFNTNIHMKPSTRSALFAFLQVDGDINFYISPKFVSFVRAIVEDKRNFLIPQEEQTVMFSTIRNTLNGQSYNPASYNLKSRGVVFGRKELKRRQTIYQELNRSVQMFKIIRENTAINQLGEIDTDLDISEAIFTFYRNNSEKILSICEELNQLFMSDIADIAIKTKFEVHKVDKAARLFFATNGSGHAVPQYIYNVFLHSLKKLDTALYGIPMCSAEMSEVMRGMLMTLKSGKRKIVQFSDNMYIIDKGCFFSIDIKSMEANHTADSMLASSVMAGLSILEKSEWPTWLVYCYWDLVFNGIKRGYCSLDGKTLSYIPLPIMPSGRAGTTFFNDIMTRYGGDLLQDIQSEIVIDGKLSDEFKAVMDSLGLMFSVELAFKADDIKEGLLEMDMLGYSAVILDATTLDLVPVLDRNRIFKSILFDQTVTNSMTVKRIISFIKTKSLIENGGLYHKDISVMMMDYLTYVAEDIKMSANTSDYYTALEEANIDPDQVDSEIGSIINYDWHSYILAKTPLSRQSHIVEIMDKLQQAYVYEPTQYSVAAFVSSKLIAMKNFYLQNINKHIDDTFDKNKILALEDRMRTLISEKYKRELFVNGVMRINTLTIDKDKIDKIIDFNKQAPIFLYNLVHNRTKDFSQMLGAILSFPLRYLGSFSESEYNIIFTLFKDLGTKINNIIKNSFLIKFKTLDPTTNKAKDQAIKDGRIGLTPEIIAQTYDTERRKKIYTYDLLSPMLTNKVIRNIQGKHRQALEQALMNTFSDVYNRINDYLKKYVPYEGNPNFDAIQVLEFSRLYTQTIQRRHIEQDKYIDFFKESVKKIIIVASDIPVLSDSSFIITFIDQVLDRKIHDKKGKPIDKRDKLLKLVFEKFRAELGEEETLPILRTKLLSGYLTPFEKLKVRNSYISDLISIFLVQKKVVYQLLALSALYTLDDTYDDFTFREALQNVFEKVVEANYNVFVTLQGTINPTQAMKFNLPVKNFPTTLDVKKLIQEIHRNPLQKILSPKREELKYPQAEYEGYSAMMKSKDLTSAPQISKEGLVVLDGDQKFQDISKEEQKMVNELISEATLDNTKENKVAKFMTSRFAIEQGVGKVLYKGKYLEGRFSITETKKGIVQVVFTKDKKIYVQIADNWLVFSVTNCRQCTLLSCIPMYKRVFMYEHPYHKKMGTTYCVEDILVTAASFLEAGFIHTNTFCSLPNMLFLASALLTYGSERNIIALEPTSYVWVDNPIFRRNIYLKPGSPSYHSFKIDPPIYPVFFFTETFYNVKSWILMSIDNPDMPFVYICKNKQLVKLLLKNPRETLDITEIIYNYLSLDYKRQEQTLLEFYKEAITNERKEEYDRLTRDMVFEKQSMIDSQEDVVENLKIQGGYVLKPTVVVNMEGFYSKKSGEISLYVQFAIQNRYGWNFYYELIEPSIQHLFADIKNYKAIQTFCSSVSEFNKKAISQGFMPRLELWTLGVNKTKPKWSVREYKRIISDCLKSLGFQKSTPQQTFNSFYDTNVILLNSTTIKETQFKNFLRSIGVPSTGVYISPHRVSKCMYSGFNTEIKRAMVDKFDFATSDSFLIPTFEYLTKEHRDEIIDALHQVGGLTQEEYEKKYKF